MKRPAPNTYVPNLAGRVDAVTDKAIQDLYKNFEGLKNRLNEVTQTIPPKLDLPTISKELSVTGNYPVNVQGLLGVLSMPQRASVSLFSSGPTSGIQAQKGTLSLINGVLSYFDTTTNPGKWIAVGATGTVLIDTHANRLANYSASKYPIGTVFYESDRKVLYINSGTFGSSNWIYLDGIMSAALASKPTDLGTNDTGFLLFVTDYNHVLRWGGAAWGWGPGDSGSGYMQMFEVDPSPLTGWQLYDGTVGVTYLKSDGTTGTVTLPDLTSIGTNAVYLKPGSPNSGPNAAVFPTFTGTAATLTGTCSAPTFSGNAMATHAHDSPVLMDAPNTTVYIGSSLSFPNGSLYSARAAITSVADSTGPHSALQTAGASAGTPSGSVSAPTLTMNSYTPAGTISGPIEMRNLVRRPFFRR